GRGLRSVWYPIHTRYTVPITFSTVNAVADASSSADTPNEAAEAWTVSPDAPPTVVSRPARRPAASAFRVTSAWSGPGIMMSTRAAPTKVHIRLRPPSGDHRAPRRPPPGAP